VEHAGDVVGVGDDLEGAHAAAALAADRDVNGEDPGQELRPAESAWPGRGVGRRAGVVRGGGEVERELELRRRSGGWDDAGAEVVVAREHPVVEHVKARRRYERVEADEEALVAALGGPL
jgi:hypothetical protein